MTRPEPPTPSTLRSLRIIERASGAGPMLYEVQALWDVGGWVTKQFFSRLDADNYAKGVMEGLNAGDGLNVVFSWNYNDNDMP